MIRTLTFLVIVALHITTYSQKNYTNPEKAAQLKKYYPDAAVVASSFSSEYTFKFDDDKLIVEQKEQSNLISLESNLKYYKNVYYNDNVDLIQGSVEYTSGRGKIKYEKVSGNCLVDGVFYSDAKIGHFTFDILYESSEVSFRSKCVYKDPKYLTKVFLQDVEPVHKRDIFFHIPAGVEVEFIEKNFDGYEIKRTQEEKEGNTIVYFSCEKLDELKDEDNSQGLLYSAPHIIVVTKSYELAGTKKKVIGSVDDLYNWYSSLVKMVKVDHSDYTEQVNTLIAGAQSEEEKIKNIYYWVQENVKYIAFEDGIAGFKPDAPGNVYNNRYGDCKGMAILTKSMLQVAGIDARLTWIGTSKIPYSHDLPSLAVDNHMVCTAFVGDEMYVLDATEKYIALGKNAERIQGKEMLIEDGESYIRMRVPMHKAEENLQVRTENIHIEKDQLVGKGTLFVIGESKKDILFLSNNSKVEDQSDYYNYLSVSESSNEDHVKVLNKPQSDRDLPLQIEYDYHITNRINQFDNELFIELDWDKRMSHADIKENRKSAFSFGRKVMSKTIKKLTIPSDYKVDYLPEAITYQDDNIMVKVSMKSSGKLITYTNEIKINNGLIRPEKFKQWNCIVEQLNTFYNDQIILKKI